MVGFAVGSDKVGAEIGVAVGSDGFSDVASKVGSDVDSEVGSSEVRRCLKVRCWLRRPILAPKAMTMLAPKSDVGSEIGSEVDSDVGSEVRRYLKTSPTLSPKSDVDSEDVDSEDVDSDCLRRRL